MSSPTKNNLFCQIPAQLDQEIFESIIDRPNIKIERIISEGQTTAKAQWYDQEQSEWIILLKGSATLKFKDPENIITLNEGDYINIPPHTLHRVEWTAEDKKTIWLAVHYG